MDPKDLYITIGVVLIGILAGTSFMAKLDSSYGTSISTEYSSINHTRSVLNSSLSNFGVELGDSVNPTDGQGTEEGSADLAKRGIRVVASLPELLGIIPTAIRDGAQAIGIPPEYSTIAVVLFVGVFAITIAYLLIAGVKNLIG